MRALFYPFSLIALVTLFLVSCSGSDTPEPTPAAPGQFKFNIGTTVYTFSGDAYLNDGNFTIYGEDSLGKHEMLLMLDNVSGTQSLTKNSTRTGVYTLDGTNFYSTSGSGTITVNTTNKTVSGTFSFTGSNYSNDIQKSITNGTFTDLPYIILY